MSKRGEGKLPNAKRGQGTRRNQALSAEEQRRRDIQKDINRQLRGWTPRRLTAWGLFVLAGIIAVQHVVAHLGVRPLPISMGWQDLFVGYPMAGFVLIAGLLALDPHPKS